MTLKKNKLVLGIAVATLSVAGAFAAPQALALSKAEAAAEVANRKVDALESQLKAMQEEMASIRAQANSPRASADSAKVQELDQWMNSVKNAPAKGKEDHHHMIFFRGGFARNDDLRNGVSIASTTDPLGPQERGGRDGWNIGAGFDFSLDDNLFGLMDKTEVLAELMFEYKEFGNITGNGLTTLPINIPTITTPTGLRTVTVNQLTLTASPKIKFMKGSSFRPWIIPIGLGLHVISPPSEAITVLNPGLQFGAGADYKVWKDLYVGADARYHLTGGAANGVNTDGFTAGGYVGIGF